MKTPLLTVASLAALLCAQAQAFTSNLTPGLDAVGGNTGSGGGTRTLSGTTPTFGPSTFTRISGNDSGSHIYGPAAPGAAAGVLFLLSGVIGSDHQPGTFGGNVDLGGLGSYEVSQQTNDLNNGLRYVNVHSNLFPGRETRDEIIATTAVRPTVSVGRNAAGGVMITFTGTLQSATSLNGKFTDVTGAISPLTVAATNLAAHIYYRARNDLIFPEDIDVLVMDAIDDGVIDGPTTVYRHPAALSPGDVVKTVAADGPDPNDGQYPPDQVVFRATDDRTYFYYVDYHTGSFHGHRVEYVFVNGVTGALTRVEGQWWPMLNDEDVFFTPEQVSDPAHIAGEIDPPSVAGHPSVRRATVAEGAGFASPQRARRLPDDCDGTETITKTALIVNGVHKDDKVRATAEEAANNARKGFIKAGYPTPQEIGTGANPGSFDKSTLLDWLNSFMAPRCSNLTIFLVSHGDVENPRESTKKKRDIFMGKRRGTEGKMYRLTGAELGAALKRLKDDGIRVKLVMETCYGGQIMAEFLSAVDVGITAGNDTEVFALDIDPNGSTKPTRGQDSNPQDTGPEFSSGYFEDYTQIHERLKDPANLALLDYLARLSLESRIPLEELILWASFKSAVEKDASIGLYGEQPVRHPPAFEDPMLNEDQLSPPNTPPGNGVPDWVDRMYGQIPPP